MRHFTNQEIADATKKVPKLIQDELSSGEDTAVVLAQMGQRYKLHIDQIGILAELNRNMLLGLVGPEEFLKELIAAGVSDKDAREIMTEINQKIFVPLRKEEEKGSMIATEVRPSPEFPKVEPQRPVPVPTPPASASQPASHFNLQNKIPVPQPISPAPKKDWSNLPPAPMKGTLPPKVFLPRPAEALSVGGPRPATLGEVVRSVLATPKPVDNTKLLEDHEEPHIAFEAKSPEVEPRGIPARPTVAPENLPGAMPPLATPHLEEIKPITPIPEVRPSPILKVEPQKQFKPESPNVEPRIQKPALVAPIEPKSVPTLITSYSSDPYREPVDEPIDEM